MAATMRPAPHGPSADRVVSLRIAHDGAGVELVSLTVVPVCTDLDEIRHGGRTIGFIRRVDRIFVALVGERRDRAEEHGQFLLWDFAAQRIVHDAAVGPACHAA